MRPVFITSNPNKAAYLQKLGIPVDHQALGLIEIQSLDLEAVLRHKVEQAFQLLQQPVLVEDVALTFTALNGLPGPLIKWFLDSIGTQGLVHMLDGCTDRTALAQVGYGLHDGHMAHLFFAEAAGSIAREPRGEHGYGFDPIFIPEGENQTWAELSDGHPSFMKARALSKVREFLQTTELQP